MKLIICPCGCRAKYHFERTINNYIDLNEIKDFLSKEEYDELASIGKFYLWATSNGKRDVNYHKYELVSEGDLALFVGNNKFVAVARVIKLMKNRVIGDYFWGTSGRDGEEHWDNLLILSKPEFLNVSFDPINNEIQNKFGTGISKMGFNVLDDDKASFLYGKLYGDELTTVTCPFSSVSIPEGYSVANFKKIENENEFNTIVFPNDVKIIKNNTLTEPVKFLNVVLPKNVVVEDGAFSGCQCGWVIIYQGTTKEFEKYVKLGSKTTYMLIHVICTDGIITYHL